MSGLSAKTPPDYLIIGHITKDQVEGGYRLGGTAVYSGVLAHRMGLNVAVYTSGASDLALDILEGIEIINQPGPGTTTFINEYTPEGRVQRLLDRAEVLDPSQIPTRWTRAKIIHLAPVARELPLSAGGLFPGGYLGYSLQGWMRAWDESGRISPAPLPRMDQPAPDQALGFVSLEDLGNDRSRLENLERQFPDLALTLGPGGMEYHSQRRTLHVPAPITPEVDPTGAGDIFAAAFLVSRHLHGKTIEESARLANALAAASVRRPGTEGIPEENEIIEITKVQR
jgi:hypothetical protein